MVVSNNEVPLNFCIGEKEQMFSPSFKQLYIYIYCFGCHQSINDVNFVE